MTKDEIGDRMKEYEARFSPRLMPLLPTFARIDGRAFHKFTARMARPYDEGFVRLMRATTEHLVGETRAICGYTQSDEITLCFYSPTTKSQIFFDGKAQKLTSVLASMATAYFAEYTGNYLTPYTYPAGKGVFDCRVWQVPTLCEAANVFVWRELDATRNSLRMLASHYYSHNQLLGRSQSEVHELLHAIDVNWDSYPSYFKRGSYFGWQDEELPHDCAAEDCKDTGPHPGPEYRKRLVDLALDPILTYPNRVRTLFGIQHSCDVVTS